MSNILDAINIKVSRALDYCAKAEEKVATETNIRSAQFDGLLSRVNALEVARDEMGTELIAKEAKIQEQKARVDELVNQLTQLGVDTGI